MGPKQKKKSSFLTDLSFFFDALLGIKERWLKYNGLGHKILYAYKLLFLECIQTVMSYFYSEEYQIIE